MATFAERRALDATKATSVAPPPPMPGGQTFRDVSASAPATTGGGSWRPLSPERAADIKLATTKDPNAFLKPLVDAARKRQGLDTPTTGPGGAPAERALPQQALDQQKTGNTLALALAGAGVVGTAIAFARGGAWWVSVLLLPAAGAAYVLTRYKVPTPVVGS